MSLLLDALNKADQERKRNEANPSIHSNHGQAGDHNTRTVSIAVIAGVVIGIAMLLVAIYWLGQRSTVTATQVTTTTSATPQLSTPKTASASQSTINTQPIAPAPTPENPLEEIQTSDEDVASLYELNTQIPEPEAQAQAPAVEPIAVTPNNSNGNAEPALSTPTSISQFANLPDLHDLPNQVLVKIPSLNYSEHNYNNIGGSVKINGEIKHANDQLAPGVVIDKILEDGMILHLENYSFKMRALNSWVNM